MAKAGFVMMWLICNEEFCMLWLETKPAAFHTQKRCFTWWTLCTASQTGSVPSQGSYHNSERLSSVKNQNIPLFTVYLKTQLNKNLMEGSRIPNLSANFLLIPSFLPAALFAFKIIQMYNHATCILKFLNIRTPEKITVIILKFN